MLSAIDGASYNLISKPRFQNIITIGDKKDFKQKYQAVNKTNLQNAQEVYVTSLRKQIKFELQGKRVSFKLDYGTYHSVPFLGVSVQFRDGFVLVNRLLSCRQAYESHTGENISRDLKAVMDEYEVEERRTLSFTTDTARNMKKGTRLVCRDFTQKEIERLEALESIESNDDSECVDDFDFESVRDDLMIDVDAKLKKKGVVTDTDCIAHVVQLMMDTFREDKKVSKVVARARDLAKILRAPNKISQLREEKINLVVLDHGVRWSYMYFMLKSILNAKNFCKRHELMATDLKISDGSWMQFEKIMKVVEPFKNLTLLLQRLDLLIPQFVHEWYMCRAKLQMMKAEKNEFADIMIKALDTRKDQIFNSTIINVAMFLDKRLLQFSSV